MAIFGSSSTINTVFIDSLPVLLYSCYRQDPAKAVGARRDIAHNSLKPRLDSQNAAHIKVSRPRIKQGPPMFESVRLPEITQSVARAFRLLIIDDDAIDRETYLRYLAGDRSASYDVLIATSASEGARLLSEGRYDCVVLDYRLPGADGLTMLQSVRGAEPGNASSPVVMMTGQGSEAVAVEAMKLGIADYLVKDGLTAEAFRRAIKNAVSRWRLHTTVAEKSRRLEQANAELKQRAEEMQRLYHVVSHELKTPLTAVREFIALVLDGVAGPLQTAEQTTYLEHALDGCDQIARHVNDLSDSSRLENEKLRLNLAPVRPERIISFALASIRHIALAKGLKLKTEISPNLPPVLADEVRLSQILGNLLGNAAKFTPPKGEISLIAQFKPGSASQIEISVRDSGCGIGPDHLDKIFNRLYQVPHAGDDLMGSGLGLGLSIARELVKLHGGELGVESTLGIGSTFKFDLPTSEQSAAPHASTRAQVTSAGGATTINK
jgi:signal transduction histidine kinase